MPSAKPIGKLSAAEAHDPGFADKDGGGGVAGSRVTAGDGIGVGAVLWTAGPASTSLSRTDGRSGSDGVRQGDTNDAGDDDGAGGYPNQLAATVAGRRVLDECDVRWRPALVLAEGIERAGPGGSPNVTARTARASDNCRFTDPTGRFRACATSCTGRSA